MLEGLSLLTDGHAAKYILAAVALYFGSALIYALREYIAIKGFGKEAKYTEILKAYLAGLFVNNITPLARAGGEALRIVWINQRCKVPKSIVTAASVYERATEGPIVGILAILAAASYHFDKMSALLIILGVLGGIVLIARSDLLLTLVERLSGDKIDARTRKLLEKGLCFGPTAAAVTALSAIIWTLDVCRIWVELIAVQQSTGIGTALAVSVANALLGIMGVTPGGLGIVEGGLIGTLVGLGYSVSSAAKFVAIERSISLVLASVVGFIVMSAYGGKEAWKLLRSRWQRTGSSQE